MGRPLAFDLHGGTHTAMRSFLLCVVLALAIACAAAQQTRPKLSETFESKGFVQIKHNGTLFFGEGWYPVSQPDGKALEAYAFGGAEHLNVYELQRFEKGKAFEIIHAGHDKTPNCHTKSLTGKMPQLWDWVEKADYVRNFTANGSKFDLWGYKTAGITLEVAVPVGYPDILAYFGRFSAGNEFSYYIEQWKTDKPHSTWFEIPRECHLGPK